MPDQIKTPSYNPSDYITLNEGDSSYHFLFDENPSLSFIINYERCIQDVNKKVCEVLGYKKLDLIGKDPLDLIHPKFRVQVSNIIDQLFNKEDTEDFATDFITSEGTIKNILLSHGRLVAYNRNFAILLSGADVTEKNKRYKEFEENMELFTRFTNLLPAGVFIKDNTGKYIFRNKYLIENFDPNGIENIKFNVDSPELSISSFVNLKDKNNNDRYCEATVFKFRLEEFKKYVGGLVFDVTDKVKSLTHSTEAEVLYRTVFANSGSGLIITNTEGKIIDCNPAFIQMTEYSDTELRQMNFQDITHPSDFANEQKLFKKIIKNSSGEQEKILKRFITKGKEIIWVNLSLHLICDESGAPVYVLEIAENITEQKLIKELFSVIAHDLRSHFHALMGLSELLADEIEDLTPDEVRKIGKELNDAFRNEYNLLENLLAWSKIQKDNIEFAPDVVNLSDAVDDSIKHLSWLGAKKHIEIRNLVEDNINIIFDDSLLQSVLHNIISNALKFSHEDSIVRIIYNAEGTSSVEISDEGTGLTEEEIEKLLKQDIFFTKPGTAQEQGTGLGLIICREFIEKNGGRLFIRSKKGIGTTVGFTVKPA